MAAKDVTEIEQSGNSNSIAKLEQKKKWMDTASMGVLLGVFLAGCTGVGLVAVGASYAIGAIGGMMGSAAAGGILGSITGAVLGTTGMFGVYAGLNKAKEAYHEKKDDIDQQIKDLTPLTPQEILRTVKMPTSLQQSFNPCAVVGMERVSEINVSPSVAPAKPAAR